MNSDLYLASRRHSPGELSRRVDSTFMGRNCTLFWKLENYLRHPGLWMIYDRAIRGTAASFDLRFNQLRPLFR